MQKELKIGLAIGAVLLVVLIVYLAVPSTDTGVAQSGDSEGGGTSADVQPQDGGDAAPEVTPPGDAVEPADRSQQATGDEVFGPSDGAPAEPDSAAAASGGTDWANLLNNGAPITTVTPSRALPQLQATKTTGGTESDTPAVTPGPSETESPVTPAEPAADPAGTTDAGPTGQTSGGTTPPAGQSDTGAAAQPQSSSGARTHKVAPGENFSTIAKLVYKDARHYLAIQKANPDIDPTRLRPGQVINLPDIAADKPGSSGNATASVGSGDSDAKLDPATHYKVKSRDSLYKIAQNIYGSSNMIDDLYELNKEAIGPDSSRLKVGMVLKLPPNPNSPSAASR